MSETWAEEVKRLQREIAERQMRLQRLICGDPRVSVHVPICTCAMGQMGLPHAAGCPLYISTMPVGEKP